MQGCSPGWGRSFQRGGGAVGRSLQVFLDHCDHGVEHDHDYDDLLCDYDDCDDVSDEDEDEDDIDHLNLRERVEMMLIMFKIVMMMICLVMICNDHLNLRERVEMARKCLEKEEEVNQ